MLTSTEPTVNVITGRKW